MDFRFSDEQTTVRDLARGILDKEVSTARLKRLETEGASLDRALWSTLAEAGLLGLAVPVELVFENVDDEMKLPFFRPRR
jgi:alkylation response protein AidB-like acyl-CoA dehydrogenase